MSFPTSPDTNAIADSLVVMLAGIEHQGAPLYRLVKKGVVPDPTDRLNYCSVTFESGTTSRYTAGWRVDDKPVFLIESGIDQTDPEEAETLLLAIRDLLLPSFIRHLSLQKTPGVYMTLLDEPDQAGYKVYPNGRIYRIHHLRVRAAAQYNVQLPPE